MSVDDSDEFVKLTPGRGSAEEFYWPGVEMSQERLLLQNERFISDIDFIRKKYGINVSYQDTSDSAYYQYTMTPPSELSNKKFQADILAVADKIRLPGTWGNIVTEYVFGFDNIGLGIYEYDEKYALGRVASDNNGKYVELRLYGDLTIPELREIVASSHVRKLVKQTASVKRPYSKDDKVGFRVHELRESGMTYDRIWKQLEREKLKYEDVSHVHKIHARFKQKVDKLYA